MDQAKYFRSKTREIILALTVLVVLCLNSGKAHATFIDTDTYCVTYGCLVVGDGVDFDVYDRYIFATNTCCVAANQPLIQWTTSTLVGAGGTVNTVTTGTLTAPPVPGATQYTRLGLDTNADGTADVAFADANANSFLDAADTQAAFSIAGAPRMALFTRTVNRSLFMTSTLDFDVYGASAKATNTGTFGPAIALANVGVGFTMTQNGTDGGQPYGANAANPTFVANAAITNLGQLSPGPTRVAEFRRVAGIRNANQAGANVMPQSIRFNIVYTLPAIDLSAGAGSADLNLTLSFYQRP
ncbi:MAG: hypothetical protein ABI790_07710 [Betaproteobacteria bacterium]